MIRRSAGLLVMAALAAAAPAAAQEMRGRAVEAGSLQPVPGAVIVLHDSTGARVAAVQADSAGRFWLEAPAPGTYTLSLRHAGYRPSVTRAVPLEAGQTLPVEVRMTLRAVAMDTVEVRARARAGISGVLLDNRTGEPVADARVTLRDSRERDVARTQTDTAGAFHMTVPQADGYTLLAERAGYQGAESALITVAPNDTVQVQLRVATDAVVLAPLTVLSTSAELMRDYQLAGFEWRRGKQPWGRFMGAEDIERLKPFYATDLLQHFPSVEVHGQFDRTITLPLRAYGNGRRCVPNLYVDGRPIRMGGGGITFDSFIPGSGIAAVEVYESPQGAPGEFPPHEDTLCGVVVIWSKVAADTDS